jgi:hypothetical protein
MSYEGFTREEVTRAAGAHDSMAMMAHPAAKKISRSMW